MASNQELFDRATALATKLDVDLPNGDLNNAQLKELVKELNALDKAQQGEADSISPVELDDSPAEPIAPTNLYCIAPGKAITTKRGILGEGEGLNGDDLSGGDDALIALIETGHIIET